MVLIVGVLAEVEMLVMSKGPSPHLSWKELACKDGTSYPEEWKNNRAVMLSEVFELIRAKWRQPIIVLSAYRTPEHNRKIGGTAKSQHMQGRALDLRPPVGVSLDEFYKEIRDMANYVTAIKGLGRYETFVHIDIRPVNKLVVWQGAGQKDDTQAA